MNVDNRESEVKKKTNFYIKDKMSFFNGWFSNRMPIGDQVLLNQRSTYILPTKAGFLLMLIIFIMMLAATNYQNNLAFLLTFLILSIGIVSIVFTFKNLQGLQFVVSGILPVFEGEVLYVNFEVASQFNKPHSGIAVGFDKRSLFYLDIPDRKNPFYSEQQFSLPLTTKKRGALLIPRIYTTSVFPFGLLRVWSWFKFKSPALVYPKPIAPPESAWKSRSECSGDDSTKERAQEDLEFDGIKEYQFGDPISRVDWKATAKERGMYLKSFTSLHSNEQNISWEAFSSVDDELKLSYLSFLVCEADRKNQAFSMEIPGHSIAIGSGHAHLHRCLSLLALYPKTGIQP